MENKNLTAVEWLVEQLPQIDWDDPFYMGILQEANRMLEKQILKSYANGSNDRLHNSIKYYNETYNK